MATIHMGCGSSTNASSSILLTMQGDGKTGTLKKGPDNSFFVRDSLLGEGGFGRVICSMFLPTKKW